MNLDWDRYKGPMSFLIGLLCLLIGQGMFMLSKALTPLLLASWKPVLAEASLVGIQIIILGLSGVLVNRKSKNRKLKMLGYGLTNLSGVAFFIFIFYFLHTVFIGQWK